MKIFDKILICFLIAFTLFMVSTTINVCFILVLGLQIDIGDSLWFQYGVSVLVFLLLIIISTIVVPLLKTGGKMIMQSNHFVTHDAKHAFENAKPYVHTHTEIKVLPNVTIYVFYGHEIAYLYNDPDRTLSITNANQFQRDFKAKLDSLDGVNLIQRKFKWYLNGKLWDGKLITIDRGIK